MKLWSTCNLIGCQGHPRKKKSCTLKAQKHGTTGKILSGDGRRRTRSIPPQYILYMLRVFPHPAEARFATVRLRK